MEKTDHVVQEDKYLRLKDTYLNLRDSVIGAVIGDITIINGANRSPEIQVFRGETDAFINGMNYFNNKINDVAGSLCVNNDKLNNAMKEASRSMVDMGNKIRVLEPLTAQTPEREINARKVAISKILEGQIKLQQSIIKEVFENSWQNDRGGKSGKSIR